MSYPPSPPSGSVRSPPASAPSRPIPTCACAGSSASPMATGSGPRQPTTPRWPRPTWPKPSPGSSRGARVRPLRVAPPDRSHRRPVTVSAGPQAGRDAAIGPRTPLPETWQFGRMSGRTLRRRQCLSLPVDLEPEGLLTTMGGPPVAERSRAMGSWVTGNVAHAHVRAVYCPVSSGMRADPEHGCLAR